jgi:mercuric ion transport protein
MVGSFLAATCCVTPALPVLFGALGLSAWLAWSDYVVLAALVVFLGIVAYAVIRRWQTQTVSTAPSRRLGRNSRIDDRT